MWLSGEHNSATRLSSLLTQTHTVGKKKTTKDFILVLTSFYCVVSRPRKQHTHTHTRRVGVDSSSLALYEWHWSWHSDLVTVGAERTYVIAAGKYDRTLGSCHIRCDSKGTFLKADDFDFIAEFVVWWVNRGCCCCRNFPLVFLTLRFVWSLCRYILLFCQFVVSVSETSRYLSLHSST